jgi:Mrp family chromosome partitioning ATPase
MTNPQALLTLSMKGGVGKTTTAIGLARALQRRGLWVAPLDVDIHGSALPRALRSDVRPAAGRQSRS